MLTKISDTFVFIHLHRLEPDATRGHLFANSKVDI